MPPYSRPAVRTACGRGCARRPGYERLDMRLGLPGDGFGSDRRTDTADAQGQPNTGIDLTADPRRILEVARTLPGQSNWAPSVAYPRLPLDSRWIVGLIGRRHLRSNNSWIITCWPWPAPTRYARSIPTTPPAWPGLYRDRHRAGRANWRSSTEITDDIRPVFAAARLGAPDAPGTLMRAAAENPR